MVEINFDEKYIICGNFDTYEDAVKACKEVEEEYFSEFSYDNSRGVKKDVIE